MPLHVECTSYMCIEYTKSLWNIWIANTVVRCNRTKNNTVRDIRVCTCVKSMTLIDTIKYVKPTLILAAHIYLLILSVISTSLSGAPAAASGISSAGGGAIHVGISQRT